MVALFQVLVSFVNGKFLKWNGLSSDALLVFRKSPDTKKTNWYPIVFKPYMSGAGAQRMMV